MILHMSRGFVLGVLSTVFVVGGLTGYLVRASAKSGDTPPLASIEDLLNAPPLPQTPSRPTKATPRTTAPVKVAPMPGSFYRLADRETLSEVAKRAYGSTKRTADLVAANPTLDPKRLQPGTLIYVPVGAEPMPTPVESGKPSTAGMAILMTGEKSVEVPAPPVFARTR